MKRDSGLPGMERVSIPLHLACVTLCLLWPGVIYHNSDLDRFVEIQAPVDGPSEAGGLRGEVEGKAEREHAEYLETMSQGRCSMTLGGVNSDQGLENHRLTSLKIPQKKARTIPTCRARNGHNLGLLSHACMRYAVITTCCALGRRVVHTSLRSECGIKDEQLAKERNPGGHQTCQSAARLNIIGTDHPLGIMGLLASPGQK